MPNWRLTSWLFVIWTCVVALLAAATLINPELRYLDIIFGAVFFAQAWLVGLVALAILWIAAYLRRGGQIRL